VRAAFAGSGAVRIAAVAAADGAAVNGADAAGESGAEQARSREGADGRIPFLLLVLALAALLFEGFLSRIFSHASLVRAGKSGEIVETVGRVRPRGGAARPSQSERVPVGGGR
jgi:hypothetical protein